MFSATTSMSTSVVLNEPAAAVGRSHLAIRATEIRSRAGDSSPPDAVTTSS